MKELTKALAAAQKVMKPALKGSDNPFFKSKYASLSEVWDACKDALSTNGLAVSQYVEIASTGPVLTTKLLHVSGDSIQGSIPLVGISDMQKMGSAITYARRYGLSAIVGVIVEDDDGEATINREPYKPATHTPVTPNNKTTTPPIVAPAAAKAPYTHHEPLGRPRAFTISEAQGKRMFAIAKTNGWSTEQLKEYLKLKFNIEHTKDLNREQYDEVCDAVLPNMAFDFAMSELNAIADSEGGNDDILL